MPGATENSLEVVRAFQLNLLLLKSTIPSKPGAFGEEDEVIASKFFSGQIPELWALLVTSDKRGGDIWTKA